MNKTCNIPTFNHYLIVETATKTTNAAGDPILTWAATKSIFGSVTPLSAREQAAFAVEGRILHKVRYRYDPTVTRDMRFLFKGSRYLNLGTPVNVDERNEINEVICEEVT